MTGVAGASVAGIFDAALSARKERKKRGLARIAVIGEFNSGKTTLVNSLLGDPVLPASVITHTSFPTLIGFSAKPSLAVEVAGGRRAAITWQQIEAPQRADTRRLHIGLPLNRLKGLRVLDTPGLGLGDELEGRRTLQACRGADLVIWCTPAMQAWKHSEQSLWLKLPPSLRRRGMLAVTFADTIRSDDDARRLLARLQADAGSFFHQIVLVR